MTPLDSPPGGWFTLPIRTELARKNRVTAEYAYEHTLLDFHEAKLEMRELAAVELVAARKELARSVNRHRRQLGLPTDKDLDAELAVQTITKVWEHYKMLAREAVRAWRSLVNALEPLTRDDSTLAADDA